MSIFALLKSTGPVAIQVNQYQVISAQSTYLATMDGDAVMILCPTPGLDDEDLSLDVLNSLAFDFEDVSGEG